MILFAACFDNVLVDGSSILPTNPSPFFIAITCGIAVGLVRFVTHHGRKNPDTSADDFDETTSEEESISAEFEVPEQLETVAVA